MAVKKITHAFDDLVDGKRILREVKLLRQLDHAWSSELRAEGLDLRTTSSGSWTCILPQGQILRPTSKSSSA